MKIIECPRDAMQGLNSFVPTELKVSYLNSLLKVGFDTLDFGSFVSNKAVPQMRDTQEVLYQLDLNNTDTKLLAIVANLKGAQKAIMFEEISYLGYPFSISETFQLRNTKQTIKQSFQVIQKIQETCLLNNKELVVYLSMAFGNPFKDPWSEELALSWVSKISALGIKIVSLADTTSSAKPEDIFKLFTMMSKNFNTIEFGLHLHTNNLDSTNKMEAGFKAGCKRFDSAIGGYGGCPFAADELVGNLSTESLLDFLTSKNECLSINKVALNNSINNSKNIFL